MDTLIRISEEVSSALAASAPVVALETSVVAQGLPAPINLEAAARQVAAVRAAGAVPAAVAVLGGRIVVGASAAEIARLADPTTRPAKAGTRDLAALLAAGRDAGTTVSATVAIAARTGIRMFTTGGIGGVHRVAAPDPAAAWGDVSADVFEIARQPVCVVCAGPKAILDLAATAEALESLGVPLVGFGTGELPGFYCDRSGIPLEHRVEDARGAARLLRMHFEALGRREGVVLAVPPPDPVPRESIESAIAVAVDDARSRGLRGKAVTPFLLDAVARATQGRSRAANLALLERNASIAGEVAAALSGPR